MREGLSGEGWIRVTPSQRRRAGTPGITKLRDMYLAYMLEVVIGIFLVLFLSVYSIIPTDSSSFLKSVLLNNRP